MLQMFSIIKDARHFKSRGSLFWPLASVLDSCFVGYKLAIATAEKNIDLLAVKSLYPVKGGPDSFEGSIPPRPYPRAGSSPL